MQTRNKLLLAGIILLFVLAGFFREYVFLNWNEQMRVTYYNSPDPHVSPAMQWLSAFDYSTLYYLKWPLTFLFSVLFAGLSVTAVHVTFHNKIYNRITWLTYAGVFAAAFLLFAIGWLLNEREATYTISRFLAGLIETPVLLAVLMASFLVHRRF
jgi:hypothetical protein